MFGVAAVTISRSVDFNGRKLALSTLQAVLDCVNASINNSQIPVGSAELSTVTIFGTEVGEG